MKKNLIVSMIAALAAVSAQAAEVKLSGDFRFRHEMIYNEPQTANQTYHQERFALRVGSLVKLSDVTAVEFRLSTGNIPSNFVTMGLNNSSGAGTLTNYDVLVDRAYFAYTGITGLTVVGGRVKNVFYAAGGSDLIAAADMNFDAIGGAYTLGLGDFNLFANAAYIWVNKVTATPSDASLLAAQIGARTKMADFDIGLGVANYHVINLGAYNMYDYGIDVGTKFGETPFALFFDYVNNSMASANNTGWLAGAKFGALKKVGDYLVSYDYRNVGANAVINSIDSTDSVQDATNDGTVHRISANYMFADATTIGLFAALGTKDPVAAGAANTNYNKYQINLGFTF